MYDLINDNVVLLNIAVAVNKPLTFPKIANTIIRKLEAQCRNQCITLPCLGCSFLGPVLFPFFTTE